MDRLLLGYETYITLYLLLPYYYYYGSLQDFLDDSIRLMNPVSVVSSAIVVGCWTHQGPMT